MDIEKQLGMNVAQLRKAKGWSQEELGFQSDLHRTYISDIERGRRNPTVAVVSELARALGVSEARLLSRK